MMYKHISNGCIFGWELGGPFSIDIEIEKNIYLACKAPAHKEDQTRYFLTSRFFGNGHVLPDKYITYFIDKKKVLRNEYTHNPQTIFMTSFELLEFLYEFLPGKADKFMFCCLTGREKDV